INLNRIMPIIIDFYQSEHICIVHKGKIEGKVFICRNCNIFYCIRCKEAISKNENACWNCGEVLDDSLVVEEEVITVSKTALETGDSLPEKKQPKKEAIDNLGQDEIHKKRK
ncbi:MAG: hypothetical protein ACFFCS_10720, partial [Candidatus Hodarchaeota archaeon]